MHTHMPMGVHCHTHTHTHMAVHTRTHTLHDAQVEAVCLVGMAWLDHFLPALVDLDDEPFEYTLNVATPDDVLSAKLDSTYYETATFAVMNNHLTGENLTLSVTSSQDASSAEVCACSHAPLARFSSIPTLHPRARAQAQH